MRTCPACGTRLEVRSWDCSGCGHSPDRYGEIPLLAPEALAVGDGFRPEGFADLAAAEDRSFWFNGRNRLIVWALSTYFPGARDLLEVGCGTGFVLRALELEFPDLRLTGCELFPDGLREARNRLTRAELLQLDARKLPFKDEFDVIGAFDVLEHIAEDEITLASIAGAVRPGGGVLVTVPQHPSLWSPVDDFACHERRYTRGELRSKLERAGLRVERLTSFVSFLLPAMAYSRRRLRARPESYQPVAEHAAAEQHAKLLGRVLATERWMIRQGVSFPAGGSLLAVARRPT